MSITLRDYDNIEYRYMNMVDEFYQNLSSDWSRVVPEYASSDLYEPDRLIVGGENDFRVPCFKRLDDESQFLGIVSTATIFGDIDIEVFVAEVPDSGVRSMRHVDIGGLPARSYLHRENVEKKDREYTPEVVSTVLGKMSELAEQYGD
jgi:hypothetical protein